MLFFICGIIACKELSTREKELKNNLNKTLHLKISKTIQQANNTLLFDDLIQTHRYIYQ